MNSSLKSIAAALLLSGAALAQGTAPATTASAPSAKPAAAMQFDVASIKPSATLDPQAVIAGKMHIGVSVDGLQVRIGYLSLSDLIMTAFKVKKHQLSGPDWMTKERWDILAKMPEGSKKDDLQPMLQALLAERFGLTYHKEPREQSVSALVIAKGGPKLKESGVDQPDPEPKPDDKGMNISFGGGSMRQNGNSMVMRMKDTPGKMTITPMMDVGKIRMENTQMTMERLCDFLTGFGDKPVVDFTELKGTYDVSFEFSMNEMMNVARKAGMAMPGMMGPPPADTGRPADAASDPASSQGLLAAIQQMGLKLESRKAPIDTIIVDKLEKSPTEN